MCLVRTELGDILIARIKGRLYAMDDRCSHIAVDLSKCWRDGYIVTCFLHGARFDLRTGKATGLETADLRSYPVVEKGDDVFIER